MRWPLPFPSRAHGHCMQRHALSNARMPYTAGHCIPAMLACMRVVMHSRCARSMQYLYIIICPYARTRCHYGGHASISLRAWRRPCKYFVQFMRIYTQIITLTRCMSKCTMHQLPMQAVCWYASNLQKTCDRVSQSEALNCKLRIRAFSA
jgi:hypothetical protein